MILDNFQAWRSPKTAKKTSKPPSQEIEGQPQPR